MVFVILGRIWLAWTCGTIQALLPWCWGHSRVPLPSFKLGFLITFYSFYILWGMRLRVHATMSIWKSEVNVQELVLCLLPLCGSTGLTSHLSSAANALPALKGAEVEKAVGGNWLSTETCVQCNCWLRIPDLASKMAPEYSSGISA